MTVFTNIKKYFLKRLSTIYRIFIQFRHSLQLMVANYDLMLTDCVLKLTIIDLMLTDTVLRIMNLDLMVGNTVLNLMNSVLMLLNHGKKGFDVSEYRLDAFEP